MAKARAEYKILYLQGGRWRVRPSNLRLVKAYKIYYGKRLIVEATEFTRPKKTAQQRRDFLFKLVQEVEKKRTRKLEKARRQRIKRKEAADRARLDAQFMAKVQRPMTDVFAPDEIQFINNYKESKIQLPQFEETYAVVPVTSRRAKIDDTLIIPIAPDGMKYTKRIVDKRITSPSLGQYHLAILDIDLDKDAYIEMTEENIEESSALVSLMLLPSILDYFMEVKSSSGLYILRLKFLNSWDDDQTYQQHGISYFRKHLTNTDEVTNLFKQTIEMLLGPKDKTDKTSKRKLRTRYLEGSKRIYITGATFEASEMK